MEMQDRHTHKGSTILERLISNMVHVEGDTFMMGAAAEQGDKAYDDEKPAHEVTLSSFSIGRYEVTQEEWQEVMGDNPSKFKGDRRPVDGVSWFGCLEFIKKLNAMTGMTFRLPTEAEWEYAARGGNKSRGYKYSGSNDLDEVAWHFDNSGWQTQDVGTKSPNELGLYDMNGNVFEWCQDWYDNYDASAVANPTGPSSGYRRVFRGGSWMTKAGDYRASFRFSYIPILRTDFLGFRLAL